MAKKPVKTFSQFGVKVDVWENNSEQGTYFSFTLQRFYKKDDEWRYSNSINQRDIPMLIELTRMANSWCVMQTQRDSQQNSS